MCSNQYHEQHNSIYTRNFEYKKKNKHARRSRITMGRSDKKEENLEGF